MKMNDYIDDFTLHLKDAANISKKTKLSNSEKKINNVLICGLGGSGIGGTIVKDILFEKSPVPIVVNKGYFVPNFVNKNTLVIVSSYSGNTEETLSALKMCEQTEAEIIIISSGGKLKSIAEKKNYNMLMIPGGNPPRAMFGYAFTLLFYVLKHYKIINDFFIKEFEEAIEVLENEKKPIQEKAKKLAKNLYKTNPIIYCADGYEGVAIRFRQQINENSKMLCSHHVIPEMNHNELLGWRTNTNGVSVVYFRSDTDYSRNSFRVDINKKIISKYTKNINEVWSREGSKIINSLYFINFGDWVSWYLSEMNSVDAIEIGVIDYLKNKLSSYDE